ncbi:MAG: ABC transporter substrate-binding protein [Spirochaetaceae bacterium]|nr:ABC transporter substrate-binding protein [Spirochaetaceae bacterium]
MKKLTVLVCAFAILGTAVFAAGGRDRSAAQNTIFTVALNGDIVALDPAFTWDFTTNPVVNQITEGLVTFDTATLKVIPHLASSWKMTDDTTYVYQVRNDIVFSDGMPMTMEDVIFSLERIRNPDTGSYLEWMYDKVTGISQTGPWELTIKLREPSPTFQFVPATAAGRIISKAYFDKHAADFGTAAGGIIGTGPFAYVSWTGGQEVVLRKNTNYWNKSVPINIDTLVFKIIPEDTTRVIALQTGQVDFTVNPPLDMIDTLSADSSLTLSSIDSFSVSFLAFNTQRAPFNDVNTRKAVFHALDLPSLQKNIIKTAGTAATVLPFGPALYGDLPRQWEQYLGRAASYPYDLAKARNYLARSANPNGFECNLVINESSLSSSKALFVQDALARINIRVNIVKLSDSEHTNYQFGGVFDAGGKRDYDMLIAGWEADYPDASGNIEPLYHSSGTGEDGGNAAAYSNPRVDELIDAQGIITDSAKRNELLFRAFDIINDDVPYIFFEYPVKQSVLNKKYTGVAINSAWLWVLPIQNVRAAR